MVISPSKNRSFACGARASPAVLPSLCPAWHTPACHRAHRPPLLATPYATRCHPCSHPPSFLFVDRRRLVLRSSRATSPTRLTQQHQLRSRRAFFAFVCAGIASTQAQPCTREAFLRAKMRHLELHFLLCSACSGAQLVLNATRASMHGFERGLFCMDRFSLNLFFRSTCKDRTSIACQISENCPCVRT